MKPIHMDEVALIAAAAADHVRHQGLQALPYLRDREEIDRQKGDALSADAWRDIAEAAAAILASVRSSSD